MSLGNENITRRGFFKNLIGLTGSIIGVGVLTKLGGCGSGLGILTEPVELNSVSDYLSNSDIQRFRSKINSHFSYFPLEENNSPPNIEGYWNITGGKRWFLQDNQFYGPTDLASGYYRFFNQTSSGNINMSYNQAGVSQSGSGNGKIFIRGSRYSSYDSLTIYSSLVVSDAAAGSSLLASIYTGKKYPSGNLILDYFHVPVEKYSGAGFFPTFGQMKFSPDGDYKTPELIGVGCAA